MAVCFLAIPSGLFAAEPELRTWSSSDGRFSTEARLVALQGGMVTLQKSTGETISAPLRSLSLQDRDYVLQREDPADPAVALFLKARTEQQPLEYVPVSEFSTAPQRRIDYLAVSRDESRALTCSNLPAGTSFVWDPATGDKICQLERSGPLNAAALGPAGKIAVISDSTRVEVFDASTGKRRNTFPVPQEAQGEIVSLTVSDDAQWYIAITADRRILRHRLSDGQGLASPPVPHEGGGRSEYFAVGPHGQAVLMSSNPAILNLYRDQGDATKVETIRLEHKAEPHAAAWSDSMTAFACSKHQLLVFLKVDDGWKRLDPMWLRLQDVARMVIAPDEEMVVLQGDGKKIQIFDISTGDIQYAEEPEPHLPKVIGSSGLTLYASYGNHFCCWKTPYREQPKTVWFRETKELLRQGEFETLDRLAGLCLADPTPFSWGELSKFDSFIDALLAPVNLRDFGDFHAVKRTAKAKAWREKNPESIAARVLLAGYQINDAWHARGDGYGDSVTPEGWRTFHAGITDAKETLEPVMQGDDPPARAYWFLFIVAMAKGWEGEQMAPLLTAFFQRYPDYTEGHQLIAQRLMPRWGGEEGETTAYIEKVADTIGGERGDIAYANMTIDQLKFHASDKFFEETRFQYDRMIRGLLALARNPNQKSYAVNYGMFFAWVQRDKATGLKFYALLDDPRYEGRWKPWGYEGLFDYVIHWLETEE
ncbi:SHD1 domain-containing protein [Lignipirellula cremea]|nr:SHD1 domain-containing protein [Lignipirellula cremea]